MKRISKTSSAVVGFIVILLIFAFYFFREKEVVISNTKWNCGESSCDVSFKAENKTSSYLSLKVSIRACKTKEIGMGYGAVGSEIVGEKIISLNMSPAQISDINESLKIAHRSNVEFIVVNSWNIKESENMP
jgi:hypothetical protein